MSSLDAITSLVEGSLALVESSMPSAGGTGKGRGRGSGKGGYRKGAGRPRRAGKGVGVGGGGTEDATRIVSSDVGRVEASTAGGRVQQAGKRSKDVEVGEEYPDLYPEPSKPFDQEKDGRGFHIKCKACLLTYQVLVPLESFQGSYWYGNVKRYTWAHEVAPRTGRHHTHIYVEWATKPSLFQVDLRLWGAVPDVSPQRGGGNGRASFDRAHCYLQVAGKEGSIEVDTNWKAGEDFHPRAEWIMGWFAQRKLSDPRGCLSRYRLLSPYLEGRIRAQLADEAVAARRAWKKHRREVILAGYSPYKKIPEVDAWLETFKTIKSRYQFLWLHGPSLNGKTEFAQALFKKPFTIKTNVSWHGYNACEHDGIVFDDVRDIHKYVIENKALFQAGGESKQHPSMTMIHALVVDTEEKPIVVCDNEPPTDSWTIANTVRIACYTQMWEDTLPGQLAEVMDESVPDPPGCFDLVQPVADSAASAAPSTPPPPVPLDLAPVLPRTAWDSPRHGHDDEAPDAYTDDLPLDMEAYED